MGTVDVDDAAPMTFLCGVTATGRTMSRSKPKSVTAEAVVPGTNQGICC